MKKKSVKDLSKIFFKKKKLKQVDKKMFNAKIARLNVAFNTGKEYE